MIVRCTRNSDKAGTESAMTDAVIVSTARTGLAKSWRGAFNMTHGATMGGARRRAAIERARTSTRRRWMTC